MKMYIEIQYTNKDGDNVESGNCVDPDSEDGKKFIADTIAEFFNHVKTIDKNAHVHICPCTIHLE
jgi:hypothetical protein